MFANTQNLNYISYIRTNKLPVTFAGALFKYFTLQSVFKHQLVSFQCMSLA